MSGAHVIRVSVGVVVRCCVGYCVCTATVYRLKGKLIVQNYLHAVLLDDTITANVSNTVHNAIPCRVGRGGSVRGVILER